MGVVFPGQVTVRVPLVALTPLTVTATADGDFAVDSSDSAPAPEAFTARTLNL